jgi:hypothetical protein
MTTEPVFIPEAQPKAQRVRSEFRFPVYDLADCVVAAKAIHEKGGGVATSDHLAAYLGYKSAANGAFINRVAAAKLFGLIEGPPGGIVITPLAQKILMPIQIPDQRQGLIDAFMRVPLYKAVYEEYHGKELPPAFGLKNALRTMFGVTPQRIDQAYRALINSAETAGFFEVRGSRTQLIMPSVPAGLPRRSTPDDEIAPDGDGDQRTGGNGGGPGGGRTPPVVLSTATPEQLKNEYVSTLIRLLSTSASGEDRAELMTKIDKLLGLPQ